jgi:predicted nucleic acid-binding protein
VVHADPDDDAVIACAIFSQSEIIVSGDSHQLDLKQYENIPILTAAELIKEISK